MTCKIKRNREHFEVYINGKFFCSADDEKEAEIEIQNYASERGDYYEIESA
jgi:hypothetical protein